MPLGGALIASLVLGAAAAPLAKQRKPFETEADAAARKIEAIEATAGNVVEAAGTAVELGSAYVGNVVDFLIED